MVLVSHILGIAAATLGTCWLFGWTISMIREVYLMAKEKNYELKGEKRDDK